MIVERIMEFTNSSLKFKQLKLYLCVAEKPSSQNRIIN
jgi:hypothetical protein